jgi:hypothetical protein
VEYTTPSNRGKISSACEKVQSAEHHVMFITTGGQKRVEKMREWTRSELAKTHDTWDYGYTFVFTALPHRIDSETHRELEDLNYIDPIQLFLTPVWEFPFTEKKVGKTVAVSPLSRCNTSVKDRARKLYSKKFQCDEKPG